MVTYLRKAFQLGWRIDFHPRKGTACPKPGCGLASLRGQPTGNRLLLATCRVILLWPHSTVTHVLQTSDKKKPRWLERDSVLLHGRRQIVTGWGRHPTIRRGLCQAGILTKTEPCTTSPGCAAGSNNVWYMPGNQSIVMTLGPWVLKRARSCSSQKEKKTFRHTIPRKPIKPKKLGNERES